MARMGGSCESSMPPCADQSAADGRGITLGHDDCSYKVGILGLMRGTGGDKFKAWKFVRSPNPSSVLASHSLASGNLEPSQTPLI